MSIGIGQILLVLLLVLILFGAGKLPKVMADIAKGVRSFKEGLEEEEIPSKEVASSSVLKKTSSKAGKETIKGVKKSSKTPQK